MKSSAITLFGGTGDLSFRKLLPALYNLESLHQLPSAFKIIIIGRRDYNNQQYIELAKPWIQKHARKKFDEEIFMKLIARISYFKMDISQLEEYHRLQKYYEKELIVDHLYYYAVAPSFFIPITEGLAKYCSENSAKVIVEKPFGEDLISATRLNDILANFFGQDKIYHIDHYLGKEMIQNILTIRFKNAIFREIWNNRYIDSVQISASEREGVGTRGGYYDKSGALKDMVQNHLLQVLSIVAMEEPKSRFFSQKQLEVLQQLKPANEIVLGQYNGYLQEENISQDSRTETFAALKLFIHNDRWSGVPFFIKTGKKLKDRETQVIIRFKAVEEAPANILIIKIQPEEGIHFQFNIKKPGTLNTLETVSMDFCQNCFLENQQNTPEAYERLLHACMNGDRSLFSKWDQIITSWKYMEEVKERAKKLPLYQYEPFSEGPIPALELTSWLD